MSCATQVFQSIPVERFEKLREKAKSSGLNFEGNSGTVEHSGVHLEWAYDPQAETLTVTCVKNHLSCRVAM